MRRAALLTLLLALGGLRAAGSAAEEAAAKVPFAGEKLTYTMSWGIIRGGVMTLTTSGLTDFEGHSAYQIDLSAISNAFVSNFFVVRDSITSWISTDTLESLRYEKHTVEGKHADDERIDFDLASGIARHNGVDIPFRRPVFDSLSAVYYLRTRNLDSPGPIELQVVSGKHAYTLEVDVLGREQVKTPAGTFWTRKVHPKMKGEGLLKKRGDLWIWFSDDAEAIPVMIRSRLNFGVLTARLSEAPAKAAGR